MSVEDGRRLGRKENVKILAWILAMVVGNWDVAGGFWSSTLGFQVTVARAAEIE
jgi:hypothetical protein